VQRHHLLGSFVFDLDMMAMRALVVNRRTPRTCTESSVPNAQRRRQERVLALADPSSSGTQEDLACPAHSREILVQRHLLGPFVFNLDMMEKPSTLIRRRFHRGGRNRPA
jgi:hypothetical protein